MSLELKDEAQYLWEYAKQYKPKFLTGAPSSHKARDQKRQWILEKEHSLPDGSTFTFGKEFEVIVLPRKDKQLYASSNAVLLDDREDNIKQWKDAGGIGVLHFDVFFSIGQLESIRERHDR